MQPGDKFKGSALLLVDLQARLAPAIPEASEVVPRIAALVAAARQADLPILATEQYSRGLGPTLPELCDLLSPEEIFEKIHFAAPREAAFRAALGARGIGHCYLAGMEAHVCVLQTGLALLGQGIAVTLLADAVASRAALSRRAALARLSRSGARLMDSAELRAGLAGAPTS